MSFLIWQNQTDCRNSLKAVEDEYGCPYKLSNGYRMDQWDFDTESREGGQFGFFAPEERPKHSVEDLRDGLIAGFSEFDERPEDWLPPEEDDGNIQL